MLSPESPEARGLVALAHARIGRGHRRTARHLAAEAVEEDPTNALLHDLHGQVLGLTRHLRRALAAHKRAVALDPTDWTYRNNLAAAHIELGHYAVALKLLRGAATDSPQQHLLHRNIVGTRDRGRATIGFVTAFLMMQVVSSNREASWGATVYVMFLMAGLGTAVYHWRVGRHLPLHLKLRSRIGRPWFRRTR